MLSRSQGKHRYPLELDEDLFRKVQIAAECRGMSVKGLIVGLLTDCLNANSALKVQGSETVENSLLKEKRLKKDISSLLGSIDSKTKMKAKRGEVAQYGPTFMKLCLLFAQATGKKKEEVWQPPFNLEEIGPQFMELVEPYKHSGSEEERRVYLQSPKFFTFVDKYERLVSLQHEIVAIQKHLLQKKGLETPAAEQEIAGGITYEQIEPASEPSERFVYRPETRPEAGTEPLTSDAAALDAFSEVPMPSFFVSQKRRRRNHG